MSNHRPYRDPGSRASIAAQHLERGTEHRSRRGKFTVHVKTMKKRLKWFLKGIPDECRTHRHYDVDWQQTTLNAKLRGYYRTTDGPGTSSACGRSTAHFRTSTRRFAESIRDLEGAVGRAQQPMRLGVIERVAGTIQQACYRSAPLNISGMTGSVKLN